MTAEVFPHHRFRAFDRQQEASSVRNGRVMRAISDARYWEAFPESYTPEQVEAGKALILNIDTDEFLPSVALVLSLGNSPFKNFPECS